MIHFSQNFFVHEPLLCHCECWREKRKARRTKRKKGIRNVERQKKEEMRRNSTNRDDCIRNVERQKKFGRQTNKEDCSKERKDTRKQYFVS